MPLQVHCTPRPSVFAADRRATVLSLASTGSDTIPLPARRGRAAAGGLHLFATTPLRHLLFAIRETHRHHDEPEPGRQYLRDNFGQHYWQLRERCVHLLDWLTALGNTAGMAEWTADAHAAGLLAGRLRGAHG